MKEDVEIIDDHFTRYLKGVGWFFKYRGSYFMASGVDPFGFGWEVLVFPCNRDGRIIEFEDLAGGRGYSYEEAIQEFVERCDDPDWQDTYAAYLRTDAIM